MLELFWAELSPTRSPSPGAFISHTNPMRQPLRVLFLFLETRVIDSRALFERPIRTKLSSYVSTKFITGMAERVENSSNEDSEGSDYDEISSSELSTSCESISVKWG